MIVRMAARWAALLLGALVVSAPAFAADAPACLATAEVPDVLQVAWVSRIGAHAGPRTAMEVVRVADLRKLAEAHERDPTRVLQSLGLIGRKAVARGDWKVVVFDVRREWLCRPAVGAEGAMIAGVSSCPANLQRKAPATRARAFSGCGYLLDVTDGARTLDVFRVEWRDAVAWGFCVLPLQRFLQGA